MPDTHFEVHGPRVLRLSFFIENRLGALQGALRVLEDVEVRALSITIHETSEHAVAHVVVDRPGIARAALADAGIPVFETALLGVVLPAESEREVGLLEVLSALLVAEVRVDEVHVLAKDLEGRRVLALHVDDLEAGRRTAADAGLEVVDQDRLGWGEPE